MNPLTIYTIFSLLKRRTLNVCTKHNFDQIAEYIVVFCHGGGFLVHLLYLLNQVASFKVATDQNTFDDSILLWFLFLSVFLSSLLSGTASTQNLIQSLTSPLLISGEAMHRVLCLVFGSPVQERHSHRGESLQICASLDLPKCCPEGSPPGTWYVTLLLDPLLIGDTQHEFASAF